MLSEDARMEIFGLFLKQGTPVKVPDWIAEEVLELFKHRKDELVKAKKRGDAVTFNQSFDVEGCPCCNKPITHNVVLESKLFEDFLK